MRSLNIVSGAFNMAKLYDYVLAVWLRLEKASETPELQDELREYLEAEFQINRLALIEESEDDTNNEMTISLQLQVTFDESQMDGDEPNEEALGALNRELRAYLESKYQVNYMELLDDALTSYLLGEREDD
jgi:hypothetical protein